MKNKLQFIIYNSIYVVLIGLLLTSCASRENIVYFQGDLESIEKQIESYSPKIQPDDLLVITISARDFEATKPFNQVNYYYQNTDEMRLQKYLVDEEGYIEYPVLGKVKLGGLTRFEAMSRMKELLKEYIIDPGVVINISNFKVTVLGEVTRPGSITLENERITILEAIGMAGDLTIYGMRKNVLVVREVDGKRTFHRVDLTSNEIFNSEVYYLMQNDVVYVEPNKAKLSSSTYSSNTPIFVSIAGLLITVISVLTR